MVRGASAETGRSATSGRQYLSPWLWVGVAGAVLQLMALGSDFYAVPGDGGALERKGAWLGIPHTSDLILLSAVVAIVLFALTAAGRSPARGRGTGLWIGVVGLLALLQLGYRMIAPPFAINIQGDQTVANLFSGDCQFYCSPAAAAESGTQLLTGIWFGLVGCVLVTVAGFAHAASRRAASSPARSWAAAEQPGPGPWLALAAIGAAASFVIAYTIFPFYVTPGQGGAVSWSGWLPTPHTSSMVLALAVVAVWLVVLAARGRAPLGPAALGGALALIGFVIASRIFLRILAPPFGGPAEIQLPAYIALVAAVLVIVAGVAHARSARRDRSTTTQP